MRFRRGETVSFGVLLFRFSHLDKKEYAIIYPPWDWDDTENRPGFCPMPWRVKSVLLHPVENNSYGFIEAL